MAKTKLFVAAPAGPLPETSPRVPAAKRGATRVMKTADLFARSDGASGDVTFEAALSRDAAAIPTQTLAQDDGAAKLRANPVTRVLPIESLLPASMVPTSRPAALSEQTPRVSTGGPRSDEDAREQVLPWHNAPRASETASRPAGAPWPSRRMQLAYAMLAATAGVLFLTGPQGRAAQLPELPPPLPAVEEALPRARAQGAEHTPASSAAQASATAPSSAAQASASAPSSAAQASAPAPSSAVVEPTPPGLVASQRAAVDALAVGDALRAAAVYDQLAAREPPLAVYAQAARILRERVAREVR